MKNEKKYQKFLDFALTVLIFISLIMLLYGLYLETGPVTVVCVVLSYIMYSWISYRLDMIENRANRAVKAIFDELLNELAQDGTDPNGKSSDRVIN